MTRVIVNLVALIASVSATYAQPRSAAGPPARQWTIAFGPSIVSTHPRPNYGTVGDGMGGILHADVMLWRWGKFNAGIGSHAGRYAELGAERVCVGFGSCSDYVHPYIQTFGGAGLAVRYGPSPTTGWQPWFRGFAEPIVGRIVQTRSIGPDWIFVASYAGAAAGVARGRFRMDLEAGLGVNVRADYPKVISLQFGFAP